MKKKILIAAAGLVAALLVVSVMVNNYYAGKVAKELENIPLPEQTEFVESVSKAGKLVANGNGMQYFGAILIKSDMTRAEMDEYFEQYRDSEWDLQVADQNVQEIVFLDHSNLSFESEVIEKENFYIVYSWGEGIKPFSELDIRGH